MLLYLSIYWCSAVLYAVFSIAGYYRNPAKINQLYNLSEKRFITAAIIEAIFIPITLFNLLIMVIKMILFKIVDKF